MMILTIDGRELSSLEITRYTPKFEVLDMEGTGRSKAPGWDMIRAPGGIICNFAVVIFSTRTDNPDYIHLMDTFYSFGGREFVQVAHRDMINRLWDQEMYYVVDGIDIRKFEDGFAYTGDLTVRFIAKKGRGYA